MTLQSIHSVIRAAAITINDSGFKLLEFEGMFPAQVRCNQVLHFTFKFDYVISITNSRTRFPQEFKEFKDVKVFMVFMFYAT